MDNVFPNAVLSAFSESNSTKWVLGTIAQFVIAVTAKARRSGYTTSRAHDRKGETL